jgi:hypothetical protein
LARWQVTAARRAGPRRRARLNAMIPRAACSLARSAPPSTHHVLLPSPSRALAADVRVRVHAAPVVGSCPARPRRHGRVRPADAVPFVGPVATALGSVRRFPLPVSGSARRLRPKLLRELVLRTLERLSCPQSGNELTPTVGDRIALRVLHVVSARDRESAHQLALATSDANGVGEVGPSRSPQYGKSPARITRQRGIHPPRPGLGRFDRRQGVSFTRRPTRDRGCGWPIRPRPPPAVPLPVVR